MINLIQKLWLKRRDLVSDEFDQALEYIAKRIPLKIHRIPTGTQCWTWTVPEKWTVEEAYIEGLDGRRLLDLKDHPLHVASYSVPVNKVVTKKELFQHLLTDPKRPGVIPYDWKFYRKDWGFCIQDNKLEHFTQDKYKVVIKSRFEKGTLKVGDYTIKGKTDKIVVLMAHLCHPAQVNDDLTGVAVLVDIARELSKKKNHYTYKFLLVPETIGSLAYLSQSESIIPKMKYGIFLEMLGNDNSHLLQRTRQDNTRLDRIARYVMRRELSKFREAGFRELLGNDEMVFNGPGINIPMISVSRWPYPEYHTSGDNLDIISEKRLAESKNIILEILNIIDNDYTPKRNFKGPVFLTGYDLWVDWRTNKKLNHNIEQIMLNLEGDKSIFEIARELDMEFYEVLDYVNKFLKAELVKKTK